MSDNTDLDAIGRIIRQRRSSMAVDNSRPVSKQTIESLINLATWAPCHKRTWPWRFAVVTEGARDQLGQVVSTAMANHGDDPAKIQKALTKYNRTSVVLIIGSAAGDTAVRTAENRDATAIAIQNIMLGATAQGLATYWGSCPKGSNEAVATFAGFESETTIVSLMYLGWADGQTQTPDRPAPIINYLN